MQARKQRRDAGTKRPGSPDVPDVVVSFRVNPDRDVRVWELYQDYLNQGYKPREIWLWALLNASGVPTNGLTAPSNGLPQASLDYLRDQIIEYLEQHQLVVASPTVDTPTKRGKKMPGETRSFIKNLLGGFDDNAGEEADE